jgi:hypothetical protein
VHAWRAAGPPRCCAPDGAPGGAANDQDRQPWPARRRLAARQAAAHRCGVSRAACARERESEKGQLPIRATCVRMPRRGAGSQCRGKR